MFIYLQEFVLLKILGKRYSIKVTLQFVRLKKESTWKEMKFTKNQRTFHYKYIHNMMMTILYSLLIKCRLEDLQWNIYQTSIFTGQTRVKWSQVLMHGTLCQKIALFQLIRSWWILNYKIHYLSFNLVNGNTPCMSGFRSINLFQWQQLMKGMVNFFTMKVLYCLLNKHRFKE